MAGLRNKMAARYNGYAAGAVYFGYMDMTYFAFTPLELKKRNLKIAVVYLYAENRFEVWLGGSNRKIQADYIKLFKQNDLGGHKQSRVEPGIDSIIELTIIEKPDYVRFDDLMQEIESKTIEFAEFVILIIKD